MAKNLNRPEFLPVNEDDLKPAHRWHRPLQAPGTTQVDFEERVEFRRLHRYRLARTRESLAKSGLGAVLCFDQYNIRYISSAVIGEWARDKLIRYSLLTGTGEPWVWDFGSAARHHRINCPGLREDHVLPVIPECAAPSGLKWVCSNKPRKRSKTLSRNKAWRTCRWASISANRQCCLHCRSKESKFVTASR